MTARLPNLFTVEGAGGQHLSDSLERVMPVTATPPGRRNDPMPESEHASLRAWLATRGVTGPTATAILGSAAAGRNRATIEAVLTAWLRTRPHS